MAGINGNTAIALCRLKNIAVMDYEEYFRNAECELAKIPKKLFNVYYTILLRDNFNGREQFNIL